ncbi:MAG: hypothetical protein K2H01_05320, partial [Ruminococcus sp.]|nr:hypothetical protein [Ruminococcus sp.]
MSSQKAIANNVIMERRAFQQAIELLRITLNTSKFCVSDSLYNNFAQIDFGLKNIDTNTLKEIENIIQQKQFKNHTPQYSKLLS